MKYLHISIKNNDKNLYYDSIKKYFREDACAKNRYYENTKISPKQREIFDLTLSILEDVTKNNPKLTKALDAGCGVGSFTFELSQRFPQLKQIVGVDFLKEIVSVAFEKTKNDKKISFIQADLLNMPFDDRNFDLTICIDVLHHIYSDDFKIVIKELTRVTEKYLLLEIRNKKNIFNFWYNHVVLPLFYRNLPVHTTSIDEVNNFIKEHNFKLHLARRIASSRYSCRRLVLVYKRADENNIC